ncbi:MAG: HlyD family type I secretion periplasmic adaptor subunit [Pseudomonadota bacterium]
MSLLNDKSVRRALATASITILSFGAWATFVPLDEGLIAQGSVVAETQRQAVQHLEGGIISTIHIQEGHEVVKNQPLMTLETSAARAEFQENATSLASETALAATLTGLLNDDLPDYSNVSIEGLDETLINDFIIRETMNFQVRLGEHDAQIDQINEKIRGLREALVARNRELQSLQDAEKIINEEVQLSERLVAASVETVDRLRTLQRSLVDNRLRQRSLESNLVEARNQIAELQSQRNVTQTTYRRDLSTELKQAQDRVEAFRARLPARVDALRRFDVLAPETGKVINFSNSTVGGVIGPGDTIMEIVPAGERVLSTVRILPHQRAQVFEGLKVRATLTAYRGFRAAPVDGVVTSVSADLKQDQVTGDSYYEARVELASDSLTEQGVEGITPGMPVQVFIFSGKSRTTLDYLLAPVRDSLYTAVRAS